MKIITLFYFIFISNISEGQNIKFSVYFRPPSDTFNFTKNSRPSIRLIAENIDSRNITVSNIADNNFYYEVQKKVNNKYINLNDSTCYSNAEPILPESGSKLVIFKKGQYLAANKDYPPLCCFFQKGTYKVRYVFWYYINKSRKTIASPWYDIYINSSMYY